MIPVKVFGIKGRIACLIREEIKQSEIFTLEDDMPDVLIDFTHDVLLEKHIDEACRLGKPLVVGTTDLSSNSMQRLLQLSKQQKVFYSPNMSIGIFALKRSLEIAARILSSTHSPEIHELHHSLKRDAPSGTALMLADFIKSLDLGWNETKDYQKEPVRNMNDIGISVSRGGQGYSSHTVSLIGNGNMLELKYHNWNSRIFAQGALKAAEFLVNIQKKSGFYIMEDLFEC